MDGRVLIVVDKQKMLYKGNYYNTWFEALKEEFPDHIIYNLRDRNKGIKDFKYVILTQSATNWLEVAFTQLRFFKFNHTTQLLKLLKISFGKNTILISKNDYSSFKTKSLIYKIFNCKNIITHCKESIGTFERFNLKCTWLPYSCNKFRFTKSKIFKSDKYLIGFIGRANVKELLSDKRYKLLEQCKKYWGKNSDIRIIDMGAHALEGEDYCKWIKSCRAILNTESRQMHINPRMWEIFASKKIPLCVPGYYEGILYPYINYIPIDIEKKEWFIKVENDLNNKDLCQRLIENNNILLDNYSLNKCMMKIKSLLI